MRGTIARLRNCYGDVEAPRVVDAVPADQTRVRAVLVDPPLRRNQGAVLGVVRPQLQARDRFDLRLSVDRRVADANLGIPPIACGHGLDFDSMASVLGLDQHPALRVMRPRSQSRFRR